MKWGGVYNVALHPNTLVSPPLCLLEFGQNSLREIVSKRCQCATTKARLTNQMVATEEAGPVTYSIIADTGLCVVVNLNRTLNCTIQVVSFTYNLYRGNKGSLDWFPVFCGVVLTSP
jgi:hypothetical protein